MATKTYSQVMIKGIRDNQEVFQNNKYIAYNKTNE